MGGGRKILLIVVAALLPVAFLYFGVRGFVVRNAVVTAEITTVRSPVDGVLSQNPLAAGQPGDGTTGLVVRNPRADTRAMDEAAADLAQVLRDIEQRQRTLDWFDEQLATAESRLRAALSALRLELQIESEVVLAEIKALEARVAYLAAQYERAQRLQGTAASQATLELTAADLEETRAKIESLRLQSEQIEQRMGFMDQQLPLTDFADHAALLSERVQDLKVERQLQVAELAALESRLDTLHDRLESEQRNFELTSEFRQAPPATAVVWEVFLGPGATVAEGATIYTYVDCDQRFVEVPVGDATSELLRPDHPVKISLYGERQSIEGRVAAVFGSAAGVTQRRTLVAHIAAADEGDAIVLIAIPPADAESRSHRLCDLGRTAYVEFDDIGFLDPLFNRLW